MVGSLSGWIFALYGLVFPFQGGGMKIFWLVILLGWLIVHPLELLISLPLGKKAGISSRRTAVNTMLFGFTWWLPVKLGVFD